MNGKSKYTEPHRESGARWKPLEAEYIEVRP